MTFISAARDRLVVLGTKPDPVRAMTSSLPSKTKTSLVLVFEGKLFVLVFLKSESLSLLLKVQPYLCSLPKGEVLVLFEGPFFVLVHEVSVFVLVFKGEVLVLVLERSVLLLVS